jgi:hypothetical protein
MGSENALNREPVLRGELAEVLERPRPDMLNDFGRRKRAKTRAGFEAFVSDETRKKSGREKIAGTCRIDNGVDREGRDSENVTLGYNDRTLLGSCHGAEDVFGAQLRHGGIKIRRLIKRMQFAFIGEKDLHRTGADKAKELVAVTIDAKGIGQG